MFTARVNGFHRGPENRRSAVPCPVRQCGKHCARRPPCGQNGFHRGLGNRLLVAFSPTRRRGKYGTQCPPRGPAFFPRRLRSLRPAVSFPHLAARKTGPSVHRADEWLSLRVGEPSVSGALSRPAVWETLCSASTARLNDFHCGPENRRSAVPCPVRQCGKRCARRPPRGPEFLPRWLRGLRPAASLPHLAVKKTGHFVHRADELLSPWAGKPLARDGWSKNALQKES